MLFSYFLFILFISFSFSSISSKSNVDSINYINWINGLFYLSKNILPGKTITPKNCYSHKYTISICFSPSYYHYVFFWIQWDFYSYWYCVFISLSNNHFIKNDNHFSQLYKYCNENPKLNKLLTLDKEMFLRLFIVYKNNTFNSTLKWRWIKWIYIFIIIRWWKIYFNSIIFKN